MIANVDNFDLLGVDELACSSQNCGGVFPREIEANEHVLGVH